ncbi:MAG: ribonuclease III [Clostridia bacterium]|nr:ribonuclease III [Clostridia bacterium]
MERFYNKDCDVNSLSPLTLAFMGDTVFDMFVRERLICQANRPVNKLHNLASKTVNAASQAEAIKKIMDILTEEETAVFRRGRNCHTNHKVKNATEGDYHYATGFEALFGYLYLKGNMERLRELFNIIIEEEKENE